MKYISLAAGLLFVFFTLLQFNDPDAWLWVALYGYAAIMCFMAFLGKQSMNAVLLGLIVYLSGSLYLFPDSLLGWFQAEEANHALSMRTPNTKMEEARESLGLLICFFTMSMYSMGFLLKALKTRISRVF